MAQSGFTPISLYFSDTAAAVPTSGNLVAGELAINTLDGKLYYKNSVGTVALLASTSGASGDVVGPASSTDNALTRFDLATGKLIQNSVGILSDAGILTGLTGITSSGSITFSSLTSGRVTYAGTSGLLQDSANLTFDGTTLTANTIGTFILSGNVTSTGNPSLNIGSGALTAGATGVTTLSATGNAAISGATGAAVLALDTTNASSRGANISFAQNGTVRGYVGVSGFILGTTASDLSIYADTGKTINLWANGQTTIGAQVNSTGVAVTGTLSATGVVTFSNYGAGTATFDAAGVISSVSDETWKTKDGIPTDPDAMLNKLKPGYWYYNDEKKETFGKARQLGFYAQNVNAAIGPEAAPEPQDGKPWGYYDRSVLAITVMSLQKALAIIENLSARVAALEAK